MIGSHGWQLVNPSGRSDVAWPGLPSALRLVSAPQTALAPPYAIPGIETRVAAGFGDDRPGVLLIVNDEPSLSLAGDALRADGRLVVPVLAVVAGAEPAVVRAALTGAPPPPRKREPERLPPDFVPPGADDPGFADALIAAEEARGNRGWYDAGTPDDPRPAYVFEFELDEAAILAEFELDRLVEFRRVPWPVLFYYRNEQWVGYNASWAITGRGKETPERREARERWWAEWRRAPRPRQLLRNPFLGTGPPSGATGTE